MSEANQCLGNTTEFSSAADFTAKYGNVALRFYLLGIARELLRDERIQVCWRYPLPQRKAIEVIYSDERKSARTAGTMKCGSGWICPVCMRYISERRRQELDTAIERSRDRYFTIMATYTVRHDKSARLKPLLADMVAAYGSVFSGRIWSNLKSEYMLRGSVRATEITYGENGWHPHFHVLMFVDRAILDDGYSSSPDEYTQSLSNQLSDRWLKMLEKRGLSGSKNRALDLRTSDDQISDYIAKFGKMPSEWNLSVSAYEVAYATAKTARNGSQSVLDLIFAAGHDRAAQALFYEYHAATKGKSQLQWSKGLKSELDIEILRDEIAAQGIETETDRLLAAVDTKVWRYIADRGFLGQLMTYANTGNADQTQWFIERMTEQYDEMTTPLPQMDIGL